MKDLSERVELADRVLQLSHADSEDDVRQRVAQLLDAFDVDVKSEYSTPGGLADLYCPNRRILIETKSVGLAGDPDRPRVPVSPQSSN